MRARSPFAGSRMMHFGEEVCAGFIPTLLPLGSFLEAAQSSVLIKMRSLQRLSWGAVASTCSISRFKQSPIWHRRRPVQHRGHLGELMRPSRLT